MLVKKLVSCMRYLAEITRAETIECAYLSLSKTGFLVWPILIHVNSKCSFYCECDSQFVGWAIILMLELRFYL